MPRNSSQTTAAADPARASDRPRRRRKEARPGEIVEAGLLEFAQNGFAGARLEDVAARAGIVKGTIYRYFDSKQALFEAAMKSKIGSFLEDVAGTVEGYPGSSEDLLRLVLLKMHNRFEDPDVLTIFGIILAEGRRFPEIAEYYHRNMISNGMSILNGVIQRGVERGEFHNGAVSAFPQAIAAPAVVAAIWRLIFDRIQPLPAEPFFEAHIELVIRGLRA